MRIFTYVALCLLAWTSHASVLSIADIRRQAKTNDTVEVRGTITGIVITKYLINDNSGGIFIKIDKNIRIKIGDVIHATANVILRDKRLSDYELIATSVVVMDHDRTASRPLDIVPADLANYESLLFHRVRVHGTVTDSFGDECDPKTHFLFIERNGARAVVCISKRYENVELPSSLIDSDVAATGIIVPNARYSRFFLQPPIMNYGKEPIEVERPAVSDPFSVKKLSLDQSSLNQAVRKAHRRSIAGTVIATATDGMFFLRTPSDESFRIHTSPRHPSPAPGMSILASGFVRQNSFFPKMNNALWREEEEEEEIPKPKLTSPNVLSVRQILSEDLGLPEIRPEFDGQLISVIGRLKGISRTSDAHCRLIVEDDGLSFVAEAVNTSPPPEGSIVKLTGACLIHETPYAGDFTYARLSGFTLLLRGPQDLVVLKSPPWWTPRRLAILIVLLSLTVIGILAWNRILRQIVTRRSHELMRESIARVEDSLRADERFQLAVEIHDSIAQNMTGVSLQMEAIEQAYNEKSPLLGKLVTTTRRTIDSCCQELRNCLYDLRTNTLKEHDIPTILKQTLEPHQGKSKLDIHLDLPRNRLTDSTFHALLCIIRELTINAVRHGNANQIKISGGFTKNNDIDITVSDDGIGFDTTKRKGPSSGHFGLQGIKERLERIGGSFELSSQYGHGTSARIKIRRIYEHQDCHCG